MNPIEVRYRDGILRFEGKMLFLGKPRLSVKEAKLTEQGDQIICNVKSGEVEQDGVTEQLEPGIYLLTIHGIFKKIRG